jgi:hypothetical protein
MRWVIRIVAVLGVLAALVAASFIYRGVSRSLEAERALYAASLTALLLDEYVATHDGAWPRSWNDLETLPANEWNMFQWPADSHAMQRYVEIDFAVNSQVLAEKKMSVLDAINVINVDLSAQEREALRDILRVMHEGTVK